MTIIDNNNNNNNNNNTITDRVIVASLLRARGRRGIAEICLRGYRSAATGGACAGAYGNKNAVVFFPKRRRSVVSK
jgi:hypothetical protein